MSATTPAPACLARPLVRLLAVLLALGALHAPSTSAAASSSVPSDDSVAQELVLTVRSALAPVTPTGDDTLPDADAPVGTASTDDDLVHPDLEPHDGPPPLRGPPAS